MATKATNSTFTNNASFDVLPDDDMFFQPAFMPEAGQIGAEAVATADSPTEDISQGTDNAEFTEDISSSDSDTIDASDLQNMVDAAAAQAEADAVNSFDSSDIDADTVTGSEATADISSAEVDVADNQDAYGIADIATADTDATDTIRNILADTDMVTEDVADSDEYDASFGGLVEDDSLAGTDYAANDITTGDFEDVAGTDVEGEAFSSDVSVADSNNEFGDFEPDNPTSGQNGEFIDVTADTIDYLGDIGIDDDMTDTGLLGDVTDAMPAGYEGDNVEIGDLFSGADVTTEDMPTDSSADIFAGSSADDVSDVGVYSVNIPEFFEVTIPEMVGASYADIEAALNNDIEASNNDNVAREDVELPQNSDIDITDIGNSDISTDDFADNVAMDNTDDIEYQDSYLDDVE